MTKNPMKITVEEEMKEATCIITVKSENLCRVQQACDNIPLANGDGYSRRETRIISFRQRVTGAALPPVAQISHE